jgi:SEC-C motif-containing protein
MNKPDCYCGSAKNFKDCCHPFLSGRSKPKTPEQLMRSRYSAFCKKNLEYLMSTHHPSKQNANNQDQLERTIHQIKWLGLKVLKTEMDPTNPRIGFVEFAAFFEENSKAGQLHEKSKFVHENGNWYYLDGEFMHPLVFSRNEPCWCGSNKKYKKCHGL